ALRTSYFPKEYFELGAIDMPLSILEALSCELPVLAPEIDSMNALLEGISDPPFYQYNGSKDSFIKQLGRICNINSHRFHEIRKRIDVKTVFATVEKTYQNLMSE
ncbi:MAG: hypothetical protein ACFFDN_45415, partial [Candidatus Hodarchaeota archaeon]